MFKPLKSAMRFTFIYWFPFIIWAVVIYSFSSAPTVQASEIHWQDFIVKKTAHIVEYFIFSLLLYRALINSNVKPGRAIIYVIAAAFIYGFTDEFHQSFTPGREPRLRDVLIDTSASLIFLFSLKKIIFKNRKLSHLAKVIQLVR